MPIGWRVDVSYPNCVHRPVEANEYANETNDDDGYDARLLRPAVSTLGALVLCNGFWVGPDLATQTFRICVVFRLRGCSE